MPFDTPPEERWMEWALREAEAGLEEGEAPVGAVIVDTQTGRAVARAHHQTRALRDPTAQAVMIALTQLASASFEDPDTAPEADKAAPMMLAVVVTQEPDLMCAGALLLHEHLTALIYGARDAKWGACGSAIDAFRAMPSTRTISVRGGVLEGRCVDLIQRGN